MKMSTSLTGTRLPTLFNITVVLNFITRTSLRVQLDKLLWTHSNRTIKPNCLTIEHFVLDDVLCQLSIFGRLTETGREWDLLTQ